MSHTPEHIRSTLLSHFDGHPERWTKGSGTFTTPAQMDAWNRGTCACPAVAGLALFDFSHTDTAHALGFGEQIDLYRWNDEPERTFEDVLARLRGEVAP